MELQDHLDEFAAAGVRVVAVTPEPVALVAAYTSRYGIEFPVLADEDSAVIRRYGILNTEVPTDNVRYGMPFPGAYLTDTEGRITQKHFNTNYRVRETAETIIRGDLGAWLDLEGYPSAAGEAGVTLALGAHDFKPFQRADLLIRISLPEGQHAYGEPVPDGYTPTTVEVRGPEELRIERPIFPSTRPLAVAELDQALPVFDGEIEIRVPLTYRNGDAEPGEVVALEADVRYQACDERVCYLPVHERVRLDVTVGSNLLADA